MRQSSQLVSVVLAIGVVVAALRAAEFVAREIIGVPCDKISVASRLRNWRFRSACMLLSLVGPSAPQFQDRLSEWPSRLSSPFTSLCLSL